MKKLRILENRLQYKFFFKDPMFVYICHHLPDKYVDSSDFYIVTSDLFDDFSGLYVDLSLFHLLDNKS